MSLTEQDAPILVGAVGSPYSRKLRAVFRFNQLGLRHQRGGRRRSSLLGYRTSMTDRTRN